MALLKYSIRNSLKLKNKVNLILKYIFRKLGVGITSYTNLVNLQKLELDTSRRDLEFIRAFKPTQYEWMIPLLEKSRSQLLQDLFVLSETNMKRDGYFVEFGATNGIDLSNTYLLETHFGWKGILAEPAKAWHKQLKANRPSASIETFCVWRDSYSTLTFNETDCLEVSTIDFFSNGDEHRKSRQSGKKYQVQSISLRDLLIQYNAPNFIDYLSIDTEGSEYEILKALDFNEYWIGVITVEHNYTIQRELIFELLTSHGYERKYEDISKFDDWYVRN